MMAIAAASCPMCHGSARLLYAATVPADAPLESEEFACTSRFVGQHDDILWCPGCRLGFTPPVDRDAVHHAYSETVDELYFAEEERRIAAFDQILDRVERWRRPPGRLVEIGSHVGMLLVAAGRRGWDAEGIEPSRWAVERGRQRYDVQLREGTIETATLPDASADCVVMVDVLEHLTDPEAALRACRRWVNSGGVVAVSTINMATPARRLLRTRWPWFMRMHLFYFTPHSLRRIFANAGLEVVSIEPSPRTFRLGYLGKRFGSGGIIRRAIAAMVGQRGIRSIPIRVRSSDLVLVVARPSRNFMQ
jgi:2-polyprenyl-3-methyl-5-hydroxy-6-metoxy-1,4-benzoquinol methylase